MKYLKLFALISALVILGGCGETDSLSGGGTTTDPTTDPTADPTTDPTTDPTDPATDPVPTTPTGVAGSISFISASPSTISIKGTGGTETSTLTFRVLDTGGFGLTNQSVAFALNSTVGGITLQPASGVSDASGYVTTVVSSGTVGTVVGVTATLQSNDSIATASSGPVISTGLPDQDSFSISADIHNPEGWGRDGETVNITIRAADYFNNPVPDGSSVSFTTEGGSIQSSCTMVDGACSVIWTSQDPRPSDGRVTILATMLGEESITDLNGNGMLDDTDSYDDLPEAFRDDNENFMRDAGSEMYKDFNNNQTYDLADGYYNGKLCNPDNQVNLCGVVKSLDVRAQIVLSMSGSNGYATFSPDPLDLTAVASGSSTMTLADLHGNALPAGSTIKLTSSNSDLTILSSSNLTVPDNSTEPFSNLVTVSKAEGKTGTGAINVEVTSPSGVVSTNGLLTVNY
jgi:hypothetical protein